MRAHPPVPVLHTVGAVCVCPRRGPVPVHTARRVGRYPASAPAPSHYLSLVCPAAMSICGKAHLSQDAGMMVPPFGSEAARDMTGEAVIGGEPGDGFAP